MHSSGLRSGRFLCFIYLVFAGVASGASRCVSIAEGTLRLRCYDLENGRTSSSAATDTPAAKPASDWEQSIVADAAREPFSLTTYRPSYVLLTHLGSVNQAPYQLLDPPEHLHEEEIKFQLSTRVKLADDVLFGKGDLWFGYSQTAYWQALSSRLSSPVREVLYEPDLHLSFLTDVSFRRVTLRSLDLGIVHQSNGRSDPLSRSWNRVFADFHLLEGGWSVDLKSWTRLREDPDHDDNPDILDYFGHYEVRTSWRNDDQLLSLTLRNVFSRPRRYGAELNWTFPLGGRLRGMVQWFGGYGENLIDYNHVNHRIGVGLVFADGL